MKQMVTLLFKAFPVFYGPERTLPEFTGTRHWTKKRRKIGHKKKSLIVTEVISELSMRMLAQVSKHVTCLWEGQSST